MPPAQLVAWSDSCTALPPPSGPIIDVGPGQAGDLPGIVAGAPSGTTIRLASGTYPLSGAVWFTTPGVTMRSASGDRDSVVLEGGLTVGEPVAIAASSVTIADLSVKRAYWHNVHVAGGSADTNNVLLHNLHVVDAREQQVKVNPNNGHFTDYGELRCSLVEITDAGRPRIADNCYTGGIDAHQSRGWKVHHNVFSGIWCPVGLPDHAIHFWTGSRDTVVEANLIVNPARAIGFGLDAASWRVYPDDPCPGAARIGHIGGVIRNNFIAVNDDRVYQSADGFDTGIGLEHACGSPTVVHNSIASTQAPRSSSIEWRFPETNATVKNNLTSHRQIGRDGGGADTAGNLENTSLDHFVSVASGDLHLVPERAGDAVKKGAPLPGGLCDTDYDGKLRAAPFDIGADEVVAAMARLASRPAAASARSGRLDIAGIDTGQQIRHRSWDGTTWSSWDSIGGSLTSDPSAVSWGAGRLDIFGRGSSGTLVHKWLDAGTWHDWEDLGGVQMIGGPGAAAWSAGRLDVFIQGADNQLWHKCYCDGAWSAWEPQGGVLTSDPTVAAWGPGRLDVFVRGTDNQMWHKCWCGGWSGWEPQGGLLTSAPDAASWGEGRLDVFVRSTGNQLWHKCWCGGSWSGWEPQGGNLGSGSGTAARAFNRLDVFARGTNNQLLYKAWDGASWSGWETQPGPP